MLGAAARAAGGAAGSNAPPEPEARDSLQRKFTTSTNNLLPTSTHLYRYLPLPTTYYLVLRREYVLCSPPTTYHTYHLLPTTYHLPSTTCHPPPTSYYLPRRASTCCAASPHGRSLAQHPLRSACMWGCGVASGGWHSRSRSTRTLVTAPSTDEIVVQIAAAARRPRDGHAAGGAGGARGNMKKTWRPAHENKIVSPHPLPTPLNELNFSAPKTTP